MSTYRYLLIDRPSVRTRDEARAFVASAAAKRGSTGVSSLLGILADLPPELWPEGLESSPARSVTAIDADAGLMDEAMFKRIWQFARTYRVHIFDEEGDALYLMSGKTITPENVAATMRDPIESLEGKTASPEGLRFDGVYRSLRQDSQSTQKGYLLFRPDGSMYMASSFRAPANALMRYLLEAGSYVAVGKTRTKAGVLSYRVRAGWGSFKGVLTLRPDGTLHRTQVRSDGRYNIEEEHEFVAAE